MGKLDLRHYISHELWSLAKMEIAVREREERGKREEREEQRKGKGGNILYGEGVFSLY